MNPKLIKAIVIEQINGVPVGRGPYRNIRPAPGSIKNFLRKMKLQFPAAVHVNFYDSLGKFLSQERYEREQVIEEKEVKRKRLKVTDLDSGFYITTQIRLFNDLIFSQWDP